MFGHFILFKSVYRFLQDGDCCRLNKNGYHKHIYLNVWCPDDGTFWEGLGNLTLLEELDYWGQDWRFQKSHHFHLSLFLSVVVS